jgi:hypothetical protein
MIFIEIIPNLYIGDIQIITHLDKLNINSVINCTKDLHFLGKFNEYTLDIKDNLEKYEIIKMYEYLTETVEFIYKNIINDKSLLVYCENGNQKSAIVICAYLIKYGKMTKNEAIKAIRTKHDSAFYPEINFGISLDMFEKKCL